MTRRETEQRKAGFPTRHYESNSGQECPRSVVIRIPLPLYFDDLLNAKVREFNPRYTSKSACNLYCLSHSLDYTERIAAVVMSY